MAPYHHVLTAQARFKVADKALSTWAGLIAGLLHCGDGVVVIEDAAQVAPLRHTRVTRVEHSGTRGTPDPLV